MISRRELHFWTWGILLASLALAAMLFVGAGYSPIAVAHAQVTQPTSIPSVVIDSTIGSLIEFITSAVGDRNFELVLAGAVLLLVWGTRTWSPAWEGWVIRDGGKVAAWLRSLHVNIMLAWVCTDRGGAALALIWGALVAAVNALVAGQSIAVAVRTGIAVALTAMGSWTAGKRLIKG
jgi:hypothetical protein